MLVVNPVTAAVVPEALTPVKTSVVVVVNPSRYVIAPFEVALPLVNVTDPVGVNLTVPVAELPVNEAPDFGVVPALNFIYEYVAVVVPPDTAVIAEAVVSTLAPL